jgi:outer membrane immunogenic protein
MNARKSLILAIAIAGAGGATQSVPAHAQTANWSGPYAGVGGGGGWGHQSQSGGILTLPGGSTSVTTITTTADGGYNLSGGLLGGSIGYNFQSNRTVYGIDADASWADISGSGTCGVGGASPHACGGDIRGVETVRGRLGYDVGPVVPSLGSVLVFASGGLAVGQVHAWDSLLGTSGDKSVMGWTIGGGLEAMLGTNWSVRVEYLHIDFGNPAVFTALPPNPEHVSTTADVVQLGLDYHFDWTGPAAPTSPMVRK